MSTPKLRFKDFNGNKFGKWEEIILGKVSDIRDGTHDSPTYIKEGYPLITSKNLKNGRLDFSDINYISKDDFESINKRSKVDIGDIIFGMIGTIGNPVLLEHEGFAIKNVALIKQKNDLINSFLIHYLQSNFFKNQVRLLNVGNTQKFLALGQIRSIKVIKPSLEEQTKIASFLSEVDKKISQLTQKHQLLSQYKQGMMQKLFSQQTRFKADDGSEFGEWEEKPLNYFLYTSKLKNKNLKYSKNEVLSVSGEIGIVNQIELLGRSYAGVSVAPYGVVEHGDIVYTKSPLKSNPYGIIKANKGKSGIVSTLYAIYKCRENIIPNLVDYYFQNDMKLNHFLKPLVKKGAKNDMKVNNDHVLTGLVCFPSSIEEQTKIVNFLSTIDQKIDVVSEQLEQAKLWKKGLLQQMFV